MKKLLFGALALAGLFSLSCTKEVNVSEATPGKNQVVMTFRATLDEATRTAYTNEKTFSWCAGDQISLRFYNPGSDEYEWVIFSTEEGGVSANFTAAVDEGLEFAGLAFYTFDGLGAVDDWDGIPNGFQQSYIDFTELDDPLSVVPLVGQPSLDDNLVFKSATGVLKINLVNIPDNVDAISVVADEANTLAGYFFLDEDDMLTQENADPDYSVNYVTIIPDIVNGTASLYVPVPVGTLYAGLAVEFYNGQNLLGKKATVKDVEVARNQFIVFPEIDVAEVIPTLDGPVDVPYTWDFEEGSLGWIFMDDDDDGYGWSVEAARSISGSMALTSASYDNETKQALTPDNWAFTPAVQLTAGNYLSFWVGAQDLNYKNEHYAVYIAKGSPNGELTTLIDETVFPNGDYLEESLDGGYQHVVIPIPAEFDNEIVCIGFRHFNCTDWFKLLIDDVAILEEAPQVTIPPYEAYLGEWSLGTAVWNIAEKENGVSYSITGIKGQGSLPAVEGLYNAKTGSFTVSEAELDQDQILSGVFGYNGSYYLNYPYNATTPSILFSAKLNDAGDINLMAGACDYGTFVSFIFINGDSQSAQTTLPAVLTPYVPVQDPNTYVWQDDFEGELGAWTFIDADDDGNNWFAASAFDVHSGDYALCSRSWLTDPLTPDNYAFTPAITLTSDNYLSFWVSADISSNYSWCAEHYAVYVATVTPALDNVANCAVLVPEQEYPKGSPAETVAETGYQHFIVPIPTEYNGQSVYIGFRHFNCTDQDFLLLDDVAVIEGAPVLLGAPKKAPAAPQLQPRSFEHRNVRLPQPKTILSVKEFTRTR